MCECVNVQDDDEKSHSDVSRLFVRFEVKRRQRLFSCLTLLPRVDNRLQYTRCPGKILHKTIDVSVYTSHTNTRTCVTATHERGGGVDVLIASGCCKDLRFVLHYHLPVPAETLRLLWRRCRVSAGLM